MNGNTILNIVFFSTMINVIFYLSKDNENLKELDSNWKETTCIPTYGYWGTIEGCKLKDKVPPYYEPEVCWVYVGEPVIKNTQVNKCDITFKKPTRRYFLINWAIYLCIFKIFNCLFFRIPAYLLKCILDSFILFPILLQYEYHLHKTEKSYFSIKRIILVMKEIYKDNFKTYCCLPQKNIYKFISLYINEHFPHIIFQNLCIFLQDNT